MKIVVFNGSPRAEKGNTHIMVEEFLKGAEEAGATVENVFLAKKKINHCLGCFECWTNSPGKCIQKDDMAELLAKFVEVDLMVFATPVYVDNVTGIMKDFMDRMIPMIDPHFETDANGEFRHCKKIERYPKIAVISNCGYPEQSHFQVLNLLFRRIARNMHSEVVAEIYRGGGELLRHRGIVLRPLIARYRKLLRRAGKEVVENLRISEELTEQLNQPIISHNQYIKGANKSWDKVLSKSGK